MARPSKIGLDYFPHDVDAVNDEKIEAMRAEYGNDGYAFFFISCERIFRAENGEINLSNTVMKKALISKIGVSADLYDRMLSTALDINLFSKEDFESRNVLTSNGIKRRFAAVSKLRERWRKNKQIFSEENPVDKSMENQEETSESKAKKSKGNNVIYTAEFELFYNEYPRPEDKRRSFNNWRTQLRHYSVDQLMSACRNYKKAKVGTEKQYLKSSANFLGKEKPFEDYIGQESTTIPMESSGSLGVKATEIDPAFLKYCQALDEQEHRQPQGEV